MKQFKLLTIICIGLSLALTSCTKQIESESDIIAISENEKITTNEDGSVTVEFINCPNHYASIEYPNIAVTQKEFNELVTFLAPRTGLTAEQIHNYLPDSNGRIKTNNHLRNFNPPSLIRARSKNGNATVKYKTSSNQANTIWLLQRVGQPFSPVTPTGETDWALDFYTSTWNGVNSKNLITPQDVFNSAISINNSTQFTSFDPSTSLSFADAIRFDSAYMSSLLEPVEVDGVTVAFPGDIVFVHFTALDETLDEEYNPAINSFAELNSCRYEIVGSSNVVTNIWQD